MKLFSSFKATWNCGLFFSLLAFWLVLWRGFSMKVETPFSNEVHIFNSTSSGFYRKNACALLSWWKLENVYLCICCFCHFTIIFHFLAFFCFFCFFAGGGSTSLSSLSKDILSIRPFLMLKTSTSPAIFSVNPVSFKILLSSLSQPLPSPPVGGHVKKASTGCRSSSWIWFTAPSKTWCWVHFP